MVLCNWVDVSHSSEGIVLSCSGVKDSMKNLEFLDSSGVKGMIKKSGILTHKASQMLRVCCVAGHII